MKTGILLINLGSPDSPSVPDLRKYLREFLMDGRVMDLAWPIRAWIVHAFILPTRPKQSAEAYHAIWGPEGSPLVLTGRKLREKLQPCFPGPVELAMRYQNPSIAKAAENLIRSGINEVILVPLFPHYAMSSYETAVEAVKTHFRKSAPAVRIRTVPPFYDEPGYIQALAESAAPFLYEPFDHFLFSFHGIPERHLHKSDPTGCHCLNKLNCCEGDKPAHQTCYRAQCFKTVRAFAEKTGLTRFSVAFQSRLGKDPWLQPYTDQEIIRLAQSGIKKLVVICPAFVADCLETLEEIGIRGRELFLQNGGLEFKLIPCLNDHPAWVAALKNIIENVQRHPQNTSPTVLV